MATSKAATWCALCGANRSSLGGTYRFVLGARSWVCSKHKEEKKVRESVIENYLVRRVNELGGEIRKVSWPGRAGAPDRFVMFPSGCFWVELKALGKVAEPHQEREHARLRKMGQRVYVIDSTAAVDEVLLHA